MVGPANAGEPPTTHLFLHNLRFGMSVFEQNLNRGKAEQDKNKKIEKKLKISKKKLQLSIRLVLKQKKTKPRQQKCETSIEKSYKEVTKPKIP